MRITPTSGKSRDETPSHHGGVDDVARQRIEREKTGKHHRGIESSIDEKKKRKETETIKVLGDSKRKTTASGKKRQRKNAEQRRRNAIFEKTF